VHLAKIHGLRLLSLRQTKATSAGLPRLAEFKDLTRLDLSGMRLKDTSLPHLSRLQGLH
jgi:hypothetical protein